MKWAGFSSKTGVKKKLEGYQNPSSLSSLLKERSDKGLPFFNGQDIKNFNLHMKKIDQLVYLVC